MLRITSLKCKTAQFFEGPYQGNPMRETAQCEGCGIGYDQAQGQLAPCEYCQSEGRDNVLYCENCHDPHAQEHFSTINQPEPMSAPFGR